MCIAHELSAWGDEADLATVPTHSATTGLTPPRLAMRSFLAWQVCIVVIDAGMIATQHRQIRWFRVSTIFMCIDVVDLASIGGHSAVWPWTD